jgi:hypothetical protein
MLRPIPFALGATFILSIAGAASAKEPTPAPQAPLPAHDVKRATPEPAPQPDEMPAERTHLSLAATPLLPIGDLSNAFSFGLGATFGVEHAVHPHVQIVGRTGYAMLFPKQGVNWTYSGIPIWGGARYTFGVGEGAYIEGLAGPSIIIASAQVRVLGTTQTASDSEVKFGTSFGGGYQKGRFDAGARIAFWNLGEAGNSTTIMASVGWSFAAF